LDCSKNAVAGVAVLYHPTSGHIRNLSTYVDQLGRLYVVDNSVEDNFATIRREMSPGQLNKIIYMPNHRNRGIAWALNRGAQAARKDGYAYLLTMDQDTTVPDGTVAALHGILKRLCREGKKIGLTAAHAIASDSVPADYRVLDIDALYVDYPMIVPTSGNLICLQAHQQVGGFDEDYFIDDVDFEYCLKLKKNGYLAAWLPQLPVAHNWGDVTRHDFLFWKNWAASHHSPLRRYYITRNRFYTLSRYKKDFPEMKRLYRRMTYEEWRGILLFEQEKIKKIRSAIVGTVHFFAGRKGPCDGGRKAMVAGR
jgi:rhamnosyltransferase